MESVVKKTKGILHRAHVVATGPSCFDILLREFDSTPAG
ncbi:hypothetical protein V3C99_008183 [Haemonchus contortus]